MNADPPTLPSEMAEIAIYCDIVEVHVPSLLPGIRQGRGVGTRGLVTSFSQRSRGRMLRKLAKCRNLSHGLFVTLTYPDGFPQAAVTWKRHLDTLIKRVHRMPWSTFGMWRIELKPRLSGSFEGYLAPHFHLLIFSADPAFLPKIEVFRRWVALAWYNIAHAGNKHRGKAGTQTDLVRNRKHAVYYSAKYVSKVEGAFSIVGHVGRHWGTWGDWDTSVSILVELTNGEYLLIRRLFRGWLKTRGNASGRYYAKRVARAPPGVGISIFGLGDTSHPSFNNDCVATIYRMIEICQQS